MFNTDNYNSRYFNDLKRVGNVMIKSSTNINKIKSEYNYYYYLPANIQRHFVQPFNLDIQKDCATYSMEYIDVKNLGELYVGGNIGISSFNKILNQLDSFKKECLITGNYKEGTLYESKKLVLDKTKSRLAFLEESKKEFLLLERIELAYNHFIEKRTTWIKKLSHGDLCLSNILWIDDLQIMKFIDPRGANLPNDIYMDEYYDLAKLSHSILGGYENILYSTKYTDPDIQKIFKNYLYKNNICYELIRVYEASLFLSMIPLHKENPNHMKLFADKCDTILKEVGF